MTCREFINFLIDYFEDDLSTPVRAEFAGHLAKCPDCTLYLKNYEETVRLGKTVFANLDEPVPLEVPEELVQAILASHQQKT